MGKAGTTLRYVSWQMFFIYIILVALGSFKIITKYVLHFELWAALIGFLFVFRQEKLKQKPKLPDWLLYIGIALILILRIIPYWTNDIAIGYDAAFYTSAINQYAEQKVEPWFQTWSPPGLFTITNIFKGMGANTNTLVVYFFILLQLCLGFAIYVFTKTLFDKNSAIFAVFLYAVSYAQYKVFQALFFKNALALILLLVALTLIAKKQYISGAICAIALCGVHQPTFLLFGLIYLLYTINIVLTKEKKLILKHIITGALIIALGLLYYLKEFKELILKHVAAFTTAVGPGAFIDFFTYEYASLAYLPLGIIGFFYTIKRKQIHFPFYWFIIAAVIVYFQLVFYNRFIIFLDIILIILSGYAVSILIQENKKATIALLAIILITMSAGTITVALQSSPHISQEELAFISSIKETTEENSSIISNMVEDAQLLQAYSNRTVIAPGLFGHGNWTLTQWKRYWTADSFSNVKDLMSNYQKPLYIYLGEKTKRGDEKKFSESCIKSVKKQERMELLKYEC